MDWGIVFSIVGFSIVLIYILDPDLLIKRQNFKVIAALSASEFAMGLVLHIARREDMSAGALLAPLPTVIYFRLCLRAFMKIVRREPIDVAFNANSGLGKDRLFAFAFFFGGLLIYAAAIMAVIMLSEYGW